MGRFWNDIRVATRLLRQSPGLSAAAILTLALGIGANTTIYSFADAILFRTLDVRDADRIVHVFEQRDEPGAHPLSYGEYPYFREAASVFEALAAHYSSAPLHVTIGGTSEALTGSVATASYFDVLQLSPAVGRFYTAGEDRARGRDAVAVISHSLWRRRFGSDVSVLGSAITINGRPFTVVGVAPAGFTGVQPRALAVDLWIPAAMFDVGYRYCDAFDRQCRIVRLIGRLRAGVTLDQARQEIHGLAERLDAGLPGGAERRGVTVQAARGLGYDAQSSERRQLDLFLGAVTLVLVITCANIAGLLLARATARRKDLAVRFAMGASRWRIACHVLAESTVLAAAGGAAGLVAATWTTELLASLYSNDSSGRVLAFDLSLTLPVVFAAFGLTLAAALLAGGLPAWHASRGSVIAVLKDEGASGGARRARLRGALVSAQVAVSVMLLIGAALVIGSVQGALDGPGFDPEHVITLRLRPALVDYSRDRAHAFQRDVIHALESLPGVVSASPSAFMSMFSAGTRVQVRDATADVGPTDAIGNSVGPHYFSTLGVPILEGREFLEQDREGAPPVVIVNDVLARRLAPDRPATGMTLVADGRPHTIVGVARDAQYYASGDAPRAQVFFSYWQAHAGDAFLNDSRTFVRVAGDPAAMMADITRAIGSVDASVPVTEAHSLRDRVAYMFQPVRMAQALLTILAALALVLSAVGLYGVLAFSVAQRTREIGLRLAIGATRSQIAAMVVRDAAVVIATGVAAGLVAAWYSTHLVASMLFGIGTRDLTAFLAAPVVIAVVALAASYLPARRAARVSPLVAMRTD